MVSTKGDDSWKCLSVQCWPLLLCIGGWGASEDGVVSFFDLVKSPCVVVSASKGCK